MAGWSIIEDGSTVNCTENRQINEINVGCLSDSDNDVKFDDCDVNLRCLFDQVLKILFRGVYAKNGIRPIPALLGDGRSVDLFKLFCLVRYQGGFGSVSEEQLWGLIAEKFGFDYKFCASLKLIYFKYLDELDQWLNRVTRDRVLSNGSYECVGNLGLLSLELEKRFRDLSSNRQELVMKDDEIGYDKICKHIDVALKNTLHLPDIGKGSEMNSCVIEAALDDDEKLCDTKKFAATSKQCAVDNDRISRKRKRDDFKGMLRWMIKAAKNPYHPSIGRIQGCSRWRENGGKDFWSLALSLREARLQRRYADSIDEQSSFHQKKGKMHPSMYEDDVLPNHHSAEDLRWNKKLFSLVKTPRSHCCKSCSVDHDDFGSPFKPLTENCCKEKDHVIADLTVTKLTMDSSDNDLPVEKFVLVGPQFQAEVPIWTGIASESDPKWLGTQIWSPHFLEDGAYSKIALPGKGRVESCNCRFPGSVECYRFHIAERRIKLRRELGLAFYHWKFDRMGEEVSLSWSIEEEKKFKEIIRLNKLSSMGKSFIRKKTWTDLVRYYFNVFLISRRSYQNRVTPKDIDSDDDEGELGSVSEAFGYNAVKVRGSEPLTCCQNEQITDLD